MKKILLIVSLTCLTSVFFAQQWKQKLPDKPEKELTFYDYQKAFNEYWAPYHVKGGYYINEEGESVKARGYKQFKRWEWLWSKKIDRETGKFPTVSTWEVWEKWKAENPQKSANGDWIPLGPSNVNSPEFGTGRINCLTFDPTDNNRYWVGAPGGGVWLTEDDGSSWTCLTDDNPVLGVSVIELHPGYNGTTNRTIFIATGDRTVMDNPSVGVLRTDDDGATWYATGFTAAPADAVKVGGLEVNPANPDIILVGASNGLYRSTDGGVTFSLRQAGNFIDMERRPGSNTSYYASTNGWHPRVFRTTDSGNTWTQVRQINNHYRCEIAVTPADPDYVYIITSEDGYACGNIERSTDGGTTWTVRYDPSDPNMFGWRTGGGDSGGQGFYDIAIAVSNTNRDHLYIGGVNSFFSTNGGTSFTAVTCWSANSYYNQNGCDVIHADHHNAYFHPNTNRLFDVNDGGVHYTDNVTALNSSVWTDITGGLANGQIYGIGVSQQTSDETLAGFQDNGTKLLPSGSSDWDDVKGGDGMHCDIDPTNDNVQWGTYVNLQIDRTTNGWASSSSIRGSGGADWAGPLEADPILANTIYIGTDAVERYNGSWTDMSSSLNSSTYLRALDVHNDGTNLVIYTSDYTNLWRSNTSGTSFVNVTNNLPANAVTDIAIDYHNPTTTAWVCLGGFDAHNVYMTTDNGATWTNISAGLPGLPCNTIVQNRQNTTENELYVGTDVGVYMKIGDDPWVLYSTGLPNVHMSDLEVYYNAIPANSRLRAASYGRGVWESDLYFSGGDVDYADLPYSTGFESGFDSNWTTMGSNGYSRIQLTTSNTPHSGSYHMTMDVTANGNYCTNEAWMRLDLSGETQVNLDFWWKDFSEENNVEDGVFFSDNGGSTFVKVFDLNGASYADNVWNEFNLDLDQLAADNGLSLTSTFVVKFQQRDNYVITTDGMAFDDISVTAGGNTAPIAEANGPYTGIEGELVSFSSSGSSDPDGTITNYLWEFGDGGTSTAANPSHTYTEDGSYTVTLTVTDNGGLTDSDNASVTIDPANVAPIAEANGPYSGTVGKTITFSSSGSYDSDGSITGYLWNFGDGGTSTAANPTHIYTTDGPFTVTLTVTDNGGLTGSDNASVTVDPVSGDYASIPYSTGFESGFDSNWSTQGSNGYSRIQLTTSNSPHSGSYHLTMDVTTNGNYCSNEAWMGLNLSGETQVDLSFWWKDFSEETNTTDGVYFSDNGGSSFVKVLDLNGASYTDNVWREFDLDLDQLASDNGLSLTSTFVVKFQQYDNYAIATDGMAFDDISVTAGGIDTDPPTGYCASLGNSSSYEWIDLVQLGDINNSSGNDGGYEDNTSMSTDIINGNSYTINFSCGFSSQSYTEFWHIFIDYNRDADFEDAGEEVFTGSSSSDGTLSGTFTVPGSTGYGYTRMRVSMKWDAAASPCETFSYGEVEDYLVFLTPTARSKHFVNYDQGLEIGFEERMFGIYPNPSTDLIYIRMPENNAVEAKIMNVDGKEVKLVNLYKDHSINISDLSPGVYLIQINDGRKIISRRFVKY